MKIPTISENFRSVAIVSMPSRYVARSCDFEDEEHRKSSGLRPAQDRPFDWLRTGPSTGSGQAMRKKSEIGSTKSETNSKHEGEMTKMEPRFQSFLIGISDLFRISR